MSDKKAIQLFSKQKRIYPKRVWGRYRKIKWVVMILTLGIYYLAPWLRYDRGLHAPDQAILIDMPNRRAYFFAIEIWPQEVYYLTGLLILAAIALFFVTSLFGRVWCGYTCPQTVWTDLFVWVERIFQGDRNTRMRLDKSPYNFNKLWRKLATHITWLVIAVLTGGAWVFYFNDAPTLMEQIIYGEVSWTVGGWILALTASTYFMAGYAREQICTYVCPYSRFQSAMFDKDSLIIGYDKARGEPRGKHKAGDSWENRGHCVDCDACTVVCPVGIDIREGLQMECIACGLCVDACNNIMDKLSLPRGLIRYDTVRNQQYRLKGKQIVTRFIRPRTLYYSLILLVVAAVMLYGLLHRSLLDLHTLHDRNPLFVTLSDGRIRNGYELKILNKSHEDKHYKLSIKGIEDADIRIQGAGVTTEEDIEVFANSVGNLRVFVTASAQPRSRKKILFKIEDLSSDLWDSDESVFISGARE